MTRRSAAGGRAAGTCVPTPPENPQSPSIVEKVAEKVVSIGNKTVSKAQDIKVGRKIALY
jgi:hypothetical protein